MRLGTTFTTLGCLALLLGTQVPGANASPDAPPAAPDTVQRFVVTHDSEQDTGQVAELAAEHVGGLGHEVTEVITDEPEETVVIALDEAVPAEEAAELRQELAELAGVADVEPVGRVLATTIPGDPGYPDQWNLHETDAGLGMPPVWNLTSGAGVTVAVLDSGSRPHSELGYTGGHDFISDLSDSMDGDGPDADPSDMGWTDPVPNECGLWHGTQVAGIIKARHDAAGLAGVAPDATVVPIRVLGSCGGDMYDVSRAIRWATGLDVTGFPANPNPARIINLSLGGTVRNPAGEAYCPSYLQSAIDRARAQGAVLVVASGNEGQSQLTDSPAICSGVITVTATTSRALAAGWADKGSQVTLAAPGEAIPTTTNLGTAAPGDEGLGLVSGTSFAAPHVSGVIALMLATEPALTPDQVTRRLQLASRPIANCDSTSCGAGLLSAGLAIRPRFTDVWVASVFFDDIEWLATQAITTGYGDGRYGYGDPVLREQMAAFLYRASGSPPVDLASCPDFTDVPSDSVFHTPICWLAGQAITTGYGDGRYGMGDPVLREQMAAFLYRASGSPPVDTTGCHTFADVPASSAFNNAICWLKQQGITTGYSATSYGYGDPVLREQMAAFLHRWLT